jgi:hypothetical protein
LKTTIDLPDDLVQEVKMRAVLSKRTVRDLVAFTRKPGRR